MRDWRRDWLKEAARKLPDSKLSAAEREEISRELAGYLEDLYGDARNRGLDDSLRSEKLRNNTRIALRELLTATSLTVGIGRLKRILMFLRLVQLRASIVEFLLRAFDGRLLRLQARQKNLPSFRSNGYGTVLSS